MSYVDMAVGLGFFLFFLAMVLMLSIQHFVEVPAATQVQEYRDAAVRLLNQFFGTSGAPSDWEATGEPPSKLGLISTIYKIPITVEELANTTRANEPVIARLALDDACSGIAWNTTIRLYNADLNATPYELVNQVPCSGSLVNESYVRFNANVSAGEKKMYYLFYTNDSGVTAPSYSISYSGPAWQPASGDAWTEGATSWAAYGGTGGIVAADSSVRLVGTSSLSISGAFDATKIGAQYNPSGTFSGVSDGMYIDAWLYVNDTSGVSAVTVLLNDSSTSVTYALPASSLDSGQWYHFSRNLTSSQWTGWSGFNSAAIDYAAFYMANSTAGIARSLKVDGLHFGPRPLEVTVFPVESELAVSRSKVDALNNMSYDELRAVLGEDYRFRVEIK
jgi:hypothetical protein